MPIPTPEHKFYVYLVGRGLQITEPSHHVNIGVGEGIRTLMGIKPIGSEPISCCQFGYTNLKMVLVVEVESTWAFANSF
jgi:hypothetical protein